jgi:ankyrin repeat protein
LHLAYQLNDFDALEDLRKMSADPNVRIRYGYTVLFLAARDGNLEMIEYFLRDWNGDYNIGDSLDKTPLGLAFELVNQDMAELFIRYGAELSPNILEQALRESSSYGVLLMFDLGYDPNTRDEHGMTALHLIYAYYLEMGLEHGNRIANRLQGLISDPNAQDNSGQTVLHLNAAHNGPAVRELLDLFHVDPEILDRDGKTVMMHCVHEFDETMVGHNENNPHSTLQVLLRESKRTG